MANDNATIEKKLATSAAKNGKTTAKNGKTPAPAKESKTVITPKSIVSLEERIQRIEEIRALSMKRAKAMGTLHELRTFNFSNDGSAEFTIADRSGKEFTTSNTNLIGLMSKHLESLLTDKIEELDTQIITFDI